LIGLSTNWGAILTGLGALAAGIGSMLSGYAALHLARKKAKEEVRHEDAIDTSSVN
jgi:hypothetical protein